MRDRLIRSRAVVLVSCSVLALTFTLRGTSAAQAPQTVVTYTGEGEHPVSIAIDKVGNAWVSLQPICEVRKYDPGWRELQRITLVHGDACSGDVGASGLAVDATGRVYAAVKGTNVEVRGVYEIDESGTPLRIAGTDQLYFPNSIAFDHNNGTMYVTETGGGAVWRVPPGGSAEKWADRPELKGGPGANGVVVDKSEVVVSVSYPAKLVRMPINGDGSAGPSTIVSLLPPTGAPPVFLFVVDDIALDVFGNVMVSSIFFSGVGWVAADGSAVQRLATISGSSAVSLAFGTGQGERKVLFVAVNRTIAPFGGSWSGIVKIDVGVPGRPLP